VEMEKIEAVELLGAAIKELPERDRTILALYYYEHLNYQEISQILSITVSRVSQVHTKIIKTLKTKLAFINV
jgi:RNA polymerase sigma factor for flagellar operon FliA